MQQANLYKVWSGNATSQTVTRRHIKAGGEINFSSASKNLAKGNAVTWHLEQNDLEEGNLLCAKQSRNIELRSSFKGLEVATIWIFTVTDVCTDVTLNAVKDVAVFGGSNGEGCWSGRDQGCEIRTHKPKSRNRSAAL